MGVAIGVATRWPDDPAHPIGVNRHRYMTDKNGKVIHTRKEFEAMLASLTPDDLAMWKARYQFAHVENRTGIKDYTGTNRDELM